MICRDPLEAELVLFGDYGQRCSIRKTPGGEDRLDDMAQAWLDGDHDRVMAYVADHESKLRSRMLEVNAAKNTQKDKLECLKNHPPRKADPERIATLRATNMSLADIARECGLSLLTVHRHLRRRADYRRKRCDRPSSPSVTS